MLNYMIFLIWMFSIIFIFMKHPLSMGCILLIQTILISLSSGYMYYNFWFSYILFMIMIGGMLVMFIYMTSVASNEKFSMPKKMMIFSLSMIFLTIILFLLMDNFYSLIFMKDANFLNNLFKFTNFSLNKFYSQPNTKIMMIIIIYLLLTLIAVVKIVGKSMGTFRQK